MTAEKVPEINPNRVLISIASPTDLIVHPSGSASSDLYRSNNVALLFRSKTAMDRVVSSIIDQTKTNARLQRSRLDNVQVSVLSAKCKDLGIGETLNLM